MKCYNYEWNTGYIVPIFKSFNPHDPVNYLPITINSCFGKLFGSIQNERMSSFLEESNVISYTQIGILKGHHRSFAVAEGRYIFI